MENNELKHNLAPYQMQKIDLINQKCLCCPYGYHIALDFLRYKAKTNPDIRIPNPEKKLEKLLLDSSHSIAPCGNSLTTTPPPSSLQLKRVSDNLNKNIKKVQCLENEVRNIPRLLNEIENLNHQLAKLKKPSYLVDASTSPYLAPNNAKKDSNAKNSESSYCVDSKDDSSDTSLLSILQISERSSVDVWSDEGYAGTGTKQEIFYAPPFHDSGTHSQTNSNSSNSDFEDCSTRTARPVTVLENEKVRHKLDLLHSTKQVHPNSCRSPRYRGSPRITKIRPRSVPVIPNSWLPINGESHFLSSNYDMPRTVDCEVHGGSPCSCSNKSTFVTETQITEEWSVEEILECRESTTSDHNIPLSAKAARRAVPTLYDIADSAPAQRQKQTSSKIYNHSASIVSAAIKIDSRLYSLPQLKPAVNRRPSLAVLDEDCDFADRVPVPTPRFKSCLEIENNVNAAPFSRSERPVLPVHNLAFHQ
ncbi:hypothetical protein Ciccas_004597 [Cichlidogyrus casuarinus]|uniref:Uncharacterized protein n=1 Tax=Cichlidogyrus casuarinus TaxID=1844966 RepID=A0ABD2QB25_9PLAT